MKRAVTILGVLVLLNMISAIAVVQTTHKTRGLFQELQSARLEHDQLTTEWAQIQLEDSTWANPDRVSRIARDQLKMTQPEEFTILGGGS